MKLTLSIDNEVIKAAKEYAAANKKSLSRLTEQFYKDIIATDKAMAFIRSLRKQKPVPYYDYKDIIPPLLNDKHQ